MSDPLARLDRHHHVWNEVTTKPTWAAHLLLGLRRARDSWRRKCAEREEDYARAMDMSVNESSEAWSKYHEAADEVATLRADNERLRAALNRDKTGMAHALAEIRVEVRGRRWLGPDGGWGSYEWEEHTTDTLRKEIDFALDAIEDLAHKALNASGTLAHDALTTKGSNHA